MIQILMLYHIAQTFFSNKIFRYLSIYFDKRCFGILNFIHTCLKGTTLFDLTKSASFYTNEVNVNVNLSLDFCVLAYRSKG